MKTAIITLPFHVNYGGYLQAYALQTVLKQMGHKAYVVSFSQQPTWRIWISYLKWKILRLVRNNYGVEDSFKDFFMLKINKKFFEQSMIFEKAILRHMWLEAIRFGEKVYKELAVCISGIH